MAQLMDAEQAYGTWERLHRAHAVDRLSRCGCSLGTLRVCTDCGRVTCRCERLVLGTLKTDGRCPCEAAGSADRAAALADLAFARESHLAWALHLEAHAADGAPCAECDGKPYKLDAAHEREWVAKYDRLIALVGGRR